MGLVDALRIAASGMTAERLRMDVIAENLANANTTRTSAGGPYRRKEVVLEPAGRPFADLLAGVRVAAIVPDPRPPRQVYDPGHPDADARGYVALPNVSPVTEMVDLITASRAYEADVQVLATAKQMALRALDLLR